MEYKDTIRVFPMIIIFHQLDMILYSVFRNQQNVKGIQSRKKIAETFGFALVWFWSRALGRLVGC